MCRTQTYLAIIILLGSTLWSTQARGAELYSDDELELQVGGLGEVGVSVAESEEETTPAPPATAIRLARLSSSGTWNQYGGLKIQVEGRSGQLELLDLALKATPTNWLEINAGRFKVPVSKEYLIPADEMRFSKRALVRDLAPGRRLGLETAVDTEIGHVGLRAAAGLFQPGPGLRRNEGQLFVAHAQVEPVHGFEIHAAFAEHVFDDNTFVDDTVDPPVEHAVFAHDRQLDAAIGYHDEHLHVIGEGLIALDDESGRVPWAAHASGAYRFNVDGIGLEPALAYDVLDEEGRLIHRGAAAFNTYWLDTNVMTTVEYEVEVPDGSLHHLVSLLLQVSF